MAVGAVQHSIRVVGRSSEAPGRSKVLPSDFPGAEDSESRELDGTLGIRCSVSVSLTLPQPCKREKAMNVRAMANSAPGEGRKIKLCSSWRIVFITELVQLLEFVL